MLDPNYRGNKEKLGKQLSFVRFLFMGLNPERFTKTIHSELMPPFDKSGSSPLWRAIGEKFFDMDYQKADTLSLSKKEFILSLYPSETIYENLLPTEAREVIGQCSKCNGERWFKNYYEPPTFNSTSKPIEQIIAENDMQKQGIEITNLDTVGGTA